ncbi:hypothetical protein AOLI_G00095650 [Acnodon oligacanthus]
MTALLCPSIRSACVELCAFLAQVQWMSWKREETRLTASAQALDNRHQHNQRRLIKHNSRKESQRQLPFGGSDTSVTHSLSLHHSQLIKPSDTEYRYTNPDLKSQPGVRFLSRLLKRQNGATNEEDNKLKGFLSM